MAVSLPVVGVKRLLNACMIQHQDPRGSESNLCTDINPGNTGPLYIGESVALEMANSIGRYCALLDKYGVSRRLGTIC